MPSVQRGIRRHGWGEHSREILYEAGFGKREVDDLLARKVAIESDQL
jgi:hypothetical protein